ncbi:MAG: hemerythrin domain-containing protein [Terriglobia bacterium]
MDAATRILRSEHEALRRMLEFTEDAADRMRRGESVQTEVLARVVEFFRIFREGCLLTKEEDFLFPTLERKGLSRQGGPIALMLIDHATGRRLMREMAEASAAYEDGSREAGKRWAGVASDFVDLMRVHLNEEEEVLFMMADTFLLPAEQAELAAGFERLEVAKAVSGRHRRIHTMTEELLQGDEELKHAG